MTPEPFTRGSAGMESRHGCAFIERPQRRVPERAGRNGGDLTPIFKIARRPREVAKLRVGGVELPLVAKKIEGQLVEPGIIKPARWSRAGDGIEKPGFKGAVSHGGKRNSMPVKRGNFGSWGAADQSERFPCLKWKNPFQCVGL